MPQREPALLWLRDCALTALVLALCTLTSWVFFQLDFVSSNYILTYILGVMYINVFTSGLVYGVVASLFSVMLVNYMFIDPFMQFRIRSDDMVTAVVMLCVSLLCSSLTGRIKVQAAQSERKAYASQVLLEASRSLLGAEDPDTILRITATQLGKLLERPVCFAPAPEHIAPGTLILPPLSQTDYRSCPALHEFSTYEHNLAMLEEENDEEMREMAKEELSDAKKRIEELEHELKILLLPKDPNDDKNIILEIRAGAGGDEAALFAAELYRMYSNYADSQHWKVEIISINENGIGGFKEVVAMVTGKGAYSKLKYEFGAFLTSPSF